MHLFKNIMEKCLTIATMINIEKTLGNIRKNNTQNFPNKNLVHTFLPITLKITTLIRSYIFCTVSFIRNYIKLK